jgi:hypothetical protein
VHSGSYGTGRFLRCLSIALAVRRVLKNVIPPAARATSSAGPTPIVPTTSKAANAQLAMATLKATSRTTATDCPVSPLDVSMIGRSGSRLWRLHDSRVVIIQPRIDVSGEDSVPRPPHYEDSDSHQHCSHHAPGGGIAVEPRNTDHRGRSQSCGEERVAVSEPGPSVHPRRHANTVPAGPARCRDRQVCPLHIIGPAATPRRSRRRRQRSCRSGEVLPIATGAPPATGQRLAALPSRM